MRLFWGCACIAALLVLSAGDGSAQSRSAAMTVTVTVVRSSVAVDAEGNSAAASSTIIPPGTAEHPTPAAPHETEAEVVIATPTATEAATSVMMVTINY